MKRFMEREVRGQGTLLPELLDDYVAEDNPVRELDLATLGFARVVPAKKGRLAYHPAVFLKLYLYGWSVPARREAARRMSMRYSLSGSN